MQPSSQNIPQRWNLPLQKINRKFDFRSACNKIPKTTAFTCILTLILGISYIKSHFFCIWVEFIFSKWNLILQSGIYFFNSPFFQSPLQFFFLPQQQSRFHIFILFIIHWRKKMHLHHQLFTEPVSKALYVSSSHRNNRTL